MISKSPYNETFEYIIDNDVESTRLHNFVNLNPDRKTVVIQGLGFVGAAMLAAVSNATDSEGNLLYNVIGVDLPDEKNYWKIARVQKGLPSVISSDESMDRAYSSAHTAGNMTATYSNTAYALADIVVVDIHLDIHKTALGKAENYHFSFEGYKRAIRTVASNIKEDALVIIETTVPPGTTQKVIYPIFEEEFSRRGLDIAQLSLAHSYERVMPGAEYLKSITDFYRVYSGINEVSKDRAREFLSSFINTKDFPLTELHSTTASEMSKVLENSFRAMNIAFMQEWTEFAQDANVNLYEVIQAIRVRPTHRNIMSPGFGVGGYCLTKDSLLADWAYRNLFDSDKHLEMSLTAINVNDVMPEYTFKLIKKHIPDLAQKKILILGVSYLNDVADTRYSPTELFYDKCTAEGAQVHVHDTIVENWIEKDVVINTCIEDLADKNYDIIIFAVRHKEYLQMSAEMMLKLFGSAQYFVDANNIISDDKAEQLILHGKTVIGVGKGHWELLTQEKFA